MSEESEYDKIWKRMRELINIKASEFIPQMYQALTKDNYSPKEARDKIKRDAINIWKADTIDRHIPEEAKQMIKVTAGQQKGKTKTEIEKEVDAEVPNKDSAGFESSKKQQQQEEEHDLPEPTQELPLDDDEQQEEQDVIYDSKMVNDLVKKVAKLEEENAQLKINRIPTRSNKFNFPYEIEFNDEMFQLIKSNSGICPFIGTVFPDKGDGYIRFDKERIQQLIKEAQKKR